MMVLSVSGSSSTMLLLLLLLSAAACCLLLADVAVCGLSVLGVEGAEVGAGFLAPDVGVCTELAVLEAAGAVDEEAAGLDVLAALFSFSSGFFSAGFFAAETEGVGALVDATAGFLAAGAVVDLDESDLVAETTGLLLLLLALVVVVVAVEAGLGVLAAGAGVVGLALG